MQVKKYLVSLSTVVDGKENLIYPQADAYILNVDLGKNAKEEILKKIFVMIDYEIEYTKGPTVYGTYIDPHSATYIDNETNELRNEITRFSLSYTQVDKIENQYSTGSKINL